MPQQYTCLQEQSSFLQLSERYKCYHLGRNSAVFTMGNNIKGETEVVLEQITSTQLHYSNLLFLKNYYYFRFPVGMIWLQIGTSFDKS